MFEIFFSHVKHKVDLTPEEQASIKAYFTPKKLRKKQYLLQEGDVCRYMSFVENGLLRSYNVDDKGNEHMLQFAWEGYPARIPLCNKQGEMAYKNTVAIIGAASNLGTSIAKGISPRYRLILMDGEQDKVAALQQEMKSQNTPAEVDILSCCKDASWEADIIVVAVPAKELTSAAIKMKEVATCKTIINAVFQGATYNELQKLLPHSKVIQVSFPLNYEQSREINESVEVLIEGADEVAMEIAAGMVEAIGFKAVKIFQVP